ncbi:MAG: LUD domain-containing protein, partial [Candidatus Latescibacterota bacterium]|nr:LUD domain-containing protein [Candidatus Latescibacterota bacterium]
AEIFEKELGVPVSHDVGEIMKVVRKYLRPIFLNADIGMTGANVGIAENGAIVIETNEGNARLVSSIPDVHICVMGTEKIVDSVDDAVMMLMAHPISAVGQHTTTYVTMQAGRSPLGDGNGREPRETHIIILDNGRSEMAKDPLFSDALNCIRCGACMNICPTYGVVGGHTFGHIYPGPIGIPWTSEVHGLEHAGNFAPLCISCGLCKEICPAEIDIPMMIAGVKDRDSEVHPHPRVNKLLMDAERAAKMGSAFAPLSNWAMHIRPFRWMMEKAIGIDRRRELPPFRRNTLAKRMNKRKPNSTLAPRHRVAFFSDIFANYNNPDLGMAAVEHLEKLGCEVIYPKQQASGYPSIGYGDLKGAKRIAEENVKLMKGWVDQGYSVVTTEPTAAYCFKKSYPKLLVGAASKEAYEVGEKTFEFFEYVEMLEDAEDYSDTLFEGKDFGFHIPCHQRPLGAGGGAMKFLERRGAKVEIVETGTCCGMAGTFGLKAGNLGYNLANAVGEPLFEGFKESGCEAIVTESSVCSIHLTEGTDMTVWHPLDLVMSTAKC